MEASAQQLKVYESELDRLLSMIEKQVDLDHRCEVDERCRRALAWRPVDRVPLVVQAPFGGAIELPEPWNGFHRYTYRETFHSPVAMFQNQLLERVVPGLLLRDDHPLSVRSNHGTIQIASLLGCRWRAHEDNYPWVEPIGSTRAIEEIAFSNCSLDPASGVLPMSVATMEFYEEKLDAYPLCREAVQISMPDLQGPLSVAEQIWGSDIYYAFSDCPDLLDRLLSKIVDTILFAAEVFRPHSRDRLAPFAHTQHCCQNPGRFLLRDDSSILLSAETYREHVMPHNIRLLKQMGEGSIHFCGDAGHLIDEMLGIPSLRGLDFGQPGMMDIESVYVKCKQRHVALMRLLPSREDIITGRAREAFPTGVVFVHETESFDDASEVVRAYRTRTTGSAADQMDRQAGLAS